MMISKERVAAKSLEIHARVDRLLETVVQGAEKGTPAHEVEGGLWEQLLAIGLELVRLLFELLSEGDVGETVETCDGKTLKRSEKPRRRQYQSIFGECELRRYVYARRKGQAAEFVPVDAHVALPESKFSYLLEDWDQYLAMDEPFDQTGETIEKILGFRQHVDSLERMNRRMAEDVSAYQMNQQTPPAEEEGAILVQTGDSKGVPIRRSADSRPIDDHQRKSGPKPDRKKMAVLGAVYSIDPVVRTPEEVVASLFRPPGAPREERPPRPRPCHKRVRASLTYVDQEGQKIHGRSAIFGWMAGEMCERNPDNRRPEVAVMDGEENLWEERRIFAPADDSVVEILDLLHVTPRLWQAANLLCSSDAERERFVRRRVHQILQGQVRSVIRGLKQMASTRNLSQKPRRQMEKIWSYFEKNQQRMRYDEYLAHGFPIASGVIEGACRHVVKDRLERTGAAWTIQGAQAMLDLRCIYLSDDWDQFVAFRVQRQTETTHPYRDLTQQLQWRTAA